MNNFTLNDPLDHVTQVAREEEKNDDDDALYNMCLCGHTENYHADDGNGGSEECNKCGVCTEFEELTSCLCRKCATELVCEHSTHEPHILSLCGEHQ